MPGYRHGLGSVSPVGRVKGDNGVRGLGEGAADWSAKPMLRGPEPSPPFLPALGRVRGDSVQPGTAGGTGGKRLESAITRARQAPIPDPMHEIAPDDFARHQAALKRLSRLAMHGQSALEAVCEVGADALEVAQFGIWLLSDEGASIVCRALFRSDGREFQSGTELHQEDFPLYFEAMSSERSIVACDAARHPATAEFAAEYLPTYGIGAMLDAPILGAGGMRGVICCEHVGPAREWTFLDQLTAASLADRVALLLQQEELQNAKERAESVADARDSFLSHMSHELRTPMVGVLSVAELLSEEELSSHAADQVGIIHRSSRCLLKIVDDILELSRFEAGSLSIDPEPTDLRAVCQDVADLFRGRAEDKGNVIEIAVHGEVSPLLMIDPLRIRQVLMNLVGNSIKFTRGGRILIEVELSGAMDDPKLSMRVKDDGIGMDDAKLARAFVSFTRGQDVGLSREGGSGLGLSICQRLVSMQGGTIALESAPLQGTCCTILLPYVAHECMPVDPGTEPPRPLAPGMHVLLAEDNPINQRVISAMLKRIGCIPITVDDGEAAVHRVQEGGIDAILMDCQMPVLDGFEATRVIRTQGVGRTIPIIALTAHAREDHRGLCEQAGMSDFLGKPTTIATLSETLARWDPRESAHGSDAASR